MDPLHNRWYATTTNSASMAEGTAEQQLQPRARASSSDGTDSARSSVDSAVGAPRGEKPTSSTRSSGGTSAVPSGTRSSEMRSSDAQKASKVADVHSPRRRLVEALGL